jgi:hypothetical protein
MARLEINNTDVIGASPPPPGITPNFDNPESIGYRVVVASIIPLTFATFILFLRAYVKLVILGKTAIDDCRS